VRNKSLKLEKITWKKSWVFR